MKAYFFNRAAILLLSIIISCTIAVAQSKGDGSTEPLTNAALVKLVHAGFKEKTIIAVIGARQARFDLSTESMIQLKKNGVSEHIILAMLARQQGIDISNEKWADDAFFDDQPMTKPGSSNQSTLPSGGDSGGSSTDIFGSSSGSSARTKTRGGVNGSAEGDTVTTGSATVHIIRPPTEAGTGGSLKLEKVASLNNDSIVELIEAGFTEGTIVRRIEQSPVDFDLSPAKIAELRRRRVTDRILSAMRAAMGDNPKASSSNPSANSDPVSR